MGNLREDFPNLRDSYIITSRKDPGYNCVAWAAGVDTEWWWPSSYYHWPERNREYSTAAFIRVFASLGYEVCENRAPEAGFEKVAIYVKDGKPKHMARQLPDGQWTSKCGKDEDITHSLNGLEDSDYGKVTVVMKRKTPTAPEALY